MKAPAQRRHGPGTRCQERDHQVRAADLKSGGPRYSQPKQMRENLTANPRRLLIVGCGNAAAGDDSAGIEIVRRLSESGDCGCDLRAETAPSVELLDIFPLADVILFVDAVTSGGVPGTLYLTPLPSKELQPSALGSLSSHGWGLAEALKLARALGRTVPPLFLLGIEAGTVTQGAPRSPAVEHAIALVVERIPQLKRLLLSREVIGTRSFSPNDRSFPGKPGFGNQESGFGLAPPARGVGKTTS
jgi:hydrogenase maturation protease